MGRTVLVCLLLVLATLAVYWPTTGFGFIDFDDGEYVRDNPVFQYGLTAETIRWAFTGAYHSNWHPVTWVSWMIDVQVAGGVNPRMMHLTNLLIHLVNVLLLFGVLRAMTGPREFRGFWPSAFVAGLFAVHPIHVESVAWISERKDVLCGLFWMLSLWSYLYYVRRPGVLRYVLLMLCFAMGLMSKGMMVTLPGVLLLLDWWPLKRGFWILDCGLWIGKGESAVDAVNPKSKIQNPKSITFLVLEKVPLLLLGIGLSVATWIIQRPTGKLEEGLWIPMTQRLSNGALAYVRYVGKMLWPGDLAVLYPSPNLIGDAWPAWKLLGAVVVFVGVTIFVGVQRRKRPYFVVGWLWFIGTMLPVIGLVQFGRQSMADRYAYIPFIGLYIIVAWGVADLTKNWPRRAALLGPVMAVVLAACAIRAHSQVGLWQDSRILFQHAIDVTDRNWVMHRNLAGLLEADGKPNEAFAHMDQALGIFPDCAWLHDHYGTMLARHDRLYEAQQQLETAVTIDPTSAQSHLNLGVVLSLRRQYDQAMQHVEMARQLDPLLAARCDAVLADLRARKGPPQP